MRRLAGLVVAVLCIGMLCVGVLVFLLDAQIPTAARVVAGIYIAVPLLILAVRIITIIRSERENS